MANINEKNLSSFFGNVPRPMEISTLGLFSGAYIQIKKAPSGQDMVCWINSEGKPVISTLGNNESVAKGARTAIYHQFGLDSVIGESKEGVYENLAKKFANTFDMNKDNEYMNKIFDPKKLELRDLFKRYYPENIKDFDNAVENFKSAYQELMGSKTQDTQDNGKKKQMTEQTAQTM